jgi:hypothetical protein
MAAYSSHRGPTLFPSPAREDASGSGGYGF